MNSAVQRSVQSEVAKAVAPLEARVARLELSDISSDLHDPARCQVAFVGFASSVSAAERLAAMESLVRDFREFRPTGYAHYYKGPLNNQTMTNSSFVFFLTA